MTDLLQRYRRILKERNLTPPSAQAMALVDAVDELFTMEMQQVASNWASHKRLDKRVTDLEKEEIA